MILGTASSQQWYYRSGLKTANLGVYVPSKVYLTEWSGLQEAWDTPDDAEAGGELRDAESSLSEYSERLGGAWWQKFAEVCDCSQYKGNLQLPA